MPGSSGGGTKGTATMEGVVRRSAQPGKPKREKSRLRAEDNEGCGGNSRGRSENSVKENKKRKSEGTGRHPGGSVACSGRCRDWVAHEADKQLAERG